MSDETDTEEDLVALVKAAIGWTETKERIPSVLELIRQAETAAAAKERRACEALAARMSPDDGPDISGAIRARGD